MMQIKKSLKTLHPYKPTNKRPNIKLDANESNNFLFNNTLTLKGIPLNLYPDSQSSSLKQRLSLLHGVDEESIMVGSGSSELIELVIKTYLNPGDTLLSIDPTFAMYEIYTTIHSGNYVKVPVDESYAIDMEQLTREAKHLNPSIIILCSPNNPTGERISKDAITTLLKSSESLVLVDEAYMDFTGEAHSMKHAVNTYSNLIVTRTFSKAYGLAGARLGYLFTSKNIIDDLSRVKTPYSVNALTQALGLEALKDSSKIFTHCKGVKIRREALKESLRDLGLVVLDSEANFLYLISNDARLKDKLLNYDIAIRAFENTVPATYRITVGSEEENNALLTALKEVSL
jgi:histidinol-phosphate aminotransferase